MVQLHLVHLKTLNLKIVRNQIQKYLQKHMNLNNKALKVFSINFHPLNCGKIFKLNQIKHLTYYGITNLRKSIFYSKNKTLSYKEPHH